MSTSTISDDVARSHLPAPFSTSSSALTLIAQGAESLLFRTTFLDPETHAALKIRPVKKWRHPNLDRRLTRARILAEARVLVKCRREGISVPAVLGLDWEQGWLAMEWIDGLMVKEVLRRWDEKMLAEKEKEKEKVTVKSEDEGEGETAREQDEILELLAQVGRAVGKLHLVSGVVHGDLTTSNMMVRRRDSSLETKPEQPSASDQRDAENNSIVLIDFGLAQQSISDEDRAVDLYVLERAFGSTHPRQEVLFEHVLTAYGEAMGKVGKIVLRRLDDVRMRGRKKSMIG